MEFCGYFVRTEEVVFTAEDLKLVLEVADLVVAEARKGLEVGRTQGLVAHSNQINVAT